MSSLPDFLSPAHYGWIVEAVRDPFAGRWHFLIEHKGTRQYIFCSDILPAQDIFEKCQQTRLELMRQANTAEAVKKRLLS